MPRQAQTAGSGFTGARDLDEKITTRAFEVKGPRSPRMLRRLELQSVPRETLVHRCDIGFGFQIEANVKQLGVTRA